MNKAPITKRFLSKRKLETIKIKRGKKDLILIGTTQRCSLIIRIPSLILALNQGDLLLLQGIVLPKSYQLARDLIANPILMRLALRFKCPTNMQLRGLLDIKMI